MKLILKKNNIEILQIELESNRKYIVGRGDDSDIVLDNEEGISRKHLKIYSHEQEKSWILEVISPHGSLFLNDEEIDQVEIQNAATFTLKSYQFEFLPQSETKKEEVKSPVDDQWDATDSPVENTGHTTPFFKDERAVHSLAVCIEGEVPEYIDLDEGDSWTVGRDESCDISIEHKHFTRKHFEIIRVGNQFKIKDLGSSNGTFLNGDKMAPNQPLSLKSEDVISVSDLTITFETRQKDFTKIIKNLPAVAEEESEMPSQFAVPKVILEEAPVDELSDENENFLNKKRIIMFSIIGAFFIGIFGYSFLESKKKIQVEKTKEKKMNETSLMMQNHYTLANRYLSQRKFQFCIHELEKLHKYANFYQDSKNILSQCNGALTAQKRAEEIDQQEKDALEIQTKVGKITEACKVKMSEFETLEDLNACLNEAILIDPSNSMVSELQQDLQNKESLQQMKDQELENQKKIRASKMILYHQAESIRKKGDVLRAVKVYKKFLATTKHAPYFKKIRGKASARMTAIQNNYTETLSSLYRDCESLIKAKQFKSAHSKCQNILKFEPKNQKAKDWMNQAEKTLRDSLKQVYLNGNLQESIGKIDEAKKYWKSIIDQDIPAGYYYKKTKIQLNKYK